MVGRNIEIQEQVLRMIIAATGALPSSFSLDREGKGDKAKSERLPPPATDKQEEEVLQQVIR